MVAFGMDIMAAVTLFGLKTTLISGRIKSPEILNEICSTTINSKLPDGKSFWFGNAI